MQEKELWRQIQKLIYAHLETNSTPNWARLEAQEFSQMKSTVAQIVEIRCAPAANAISLERLFADISLLHQQEREKMDQCEEILILFLHILGMLRPLYAILEGRFASDWISLLLSGLKHSNEQVSGKCKNLILELLLSKSRVLVPHPQTGTQMETLEQSLMKSWSQDDDSGSEDKLQFALSEVLLKFAEKDVQSCMQALRPLLQSPETRLKTLLWLGMYIKKNPCNLKDFVLTTVFDDLLSCLSYDESRTILSIATELLAMLLPVTCPILATRLKSIFSCYRRLASLVIPNAILSPIDKKTISWDIIPEASNLDADETPSDTNRLIRAVHSLFTTLYSLFPCNFIDDMKEHADDVQVFNFSETLLSQHKFNKDLLEFTPSYELSADRWRYFDSEKAYTPMAQLMDVGMMSQPVHDSVKPSISLEMPPTRSRAASKIETSANQLPNDFLRKFKDQSLAGDELLMNDEMFWTSDASPQKPDNSDGQKPDKYFPLPNTFISADPAKTGTAENNGEFSAREILDAILTTNRIRQSTDTLPKTRDTDLLLLQSQLDFERHLNEQMLKLIKQLNAEKMRMKETEGNRETLYQAFRNQKQELTQLRESMERQKKEMTLIQQKHIKWESELSSKLRVARDECKRLQHIHEQRSHEMTFLQKYYEDGQKMHSQQIDLIQRLQSLVQVASTGGTDLTSLADDIHRLRETLCSNRDSFHDVLRSTVFNEKVRN